MHVMHVIDGLPLGGAERMLVDIANAAVASKLKVSACVTRNCIDLAQSLNSEIPLHVLGRRKQFELGAMRRLARIVRDTQVDIIQAHSRSTFSMLAILKLSFALRRIPIVLHDHFGSIERDERIACWFRWIGRHCLSYYVGVYERLGQWARRAGIPHDRVEVIGNALDLSRIRNSPAAAVRSEFGFSAGDRLGVVVAGIRHDKGIDVMLEALALSPLPPGTRVLVIGGDADPDYGRFCRQLAAQLKLEDVVRFVGCRSDVPSLIKGADFALIPSRSESGPLVLIEYLVVGLPFISTISGDIAHRTSRAGMGEFVPPNDARAFRRALDILLASSQTDWRARGSAGRQVAEELFEIRNVMPRWHEVYRRVLHSDA